MLVIYRVDAVKRTNVPNHLRTLEEMNALDRVLAHDSCRGWFNQLVSTDNTQPPDIDAPVYSLPTIFAKGIHFFQSAGLAADYYLSRYVTEADAFVAWSGMSPFTLERANELGMETFVIRASPHILEARTVLETEYERFGIENPITRINAAVECYEYQIADHIVTVSEYTARSFGRFGIDMDKVHVVPYECNLEGLFDIPDESPDDTFTVCTATSIGPIRGVQYLLLGWEQFADEKDDVHLRIAGGKKDTFPDELYDRLSNRNDVTFHGYINDIASLYSESDVFVLPSLSDGGPCGPLEAMSAGLPVVVSDKMGAEMEVEDGESGFVVPAQDESVIVDRLEQLYEDKELREEMGHRAREHATTVPGRERRKFEELLRSFS